MRSWKYFPESGKIVKRLSIYESGMLVKHVLLANNVLILAVGVIMVAFGVAMRVERENVGPLQSLEADPTYILVGIGCLVLVISVIGCAGVILENVWIIKMYYVAVGVAFFLELVAAIFAIILIFNLEQATANSIIKAIQLYGTDNNQVESALDRLQQKYSCCGVKGIADWDRNSLYNCSALTAKSCGLPSSCCKKPVDKCGMEARKYGKNFVPKNIFSNGCVSVLMDNFMLSSVITSSALIIIGVLELTAIFFAHKIMKNLRIQNADGSSKV